MGAATKALATKGYTEKLLDAGHWLMLEASDDTSSILAEFARDVADHV